ncbi:MULTISPECIES: hypothetical protein [Argonema]|nr:MULTISPECIES: hypothetical protein [Argonema]MCL1465309.1 hypothetical protein [Argonema galeatum A003/A1]MCL1475311.1 hypothetical protein [Argonema antarcticum A004/B2]
MKRSPTEREPINEAIGLHRTHVSTGLVWAIAAHSWTRKRQILRQGS